MSKFLRWSLWIYRRLLILYPDDLRREFGAEMIEAFAQDLSVACPTGSIKVAMRVWRTTLRELVQIGFPVWLQIPAVAVPALSAVATIVSQSPLLIVTIRRQANGSFRPGDATLADALVAVSIAAAGAAVTSFVSVRRSKRAALVCLDLGGLNIG